MINHWSTLRVDEASVMQLGKLDTRSIVRHADVLASGRPGPADLFERWDRQQWRLSDIDLQQDIYDFNNRLPARFRDELKRMIYTFILGEFTGTDLLSPVMLGCPDENDLLFVTTQASDEAKHSALMFRLGRELLEISDSPDEMLRTAWDTADPAHKELSVIEGQIMGAVVNNPGDYESWLRGVTLFHMVNEGVLAISGQRLVVGLLGRIRALPGLRSAFAALSRDESRHISYGMHALRQGVAEGHREAMEDVLEKTLPLAMELASFNETSESTLWDLQERAARRVFGHVGMTEEFTNHMFEKVLPQLQIAN